MLRIAEHSVPRGFFFLLLTKVADRVFSIAAALSKQQNWETVPAQEYIKEYFKLVGEGHGQVKDVVSEVVPEHIKIRLYRYESFHIFIQSVYCVLSEESYMCSAHPRTFSKKL